LKIVCGALTGLPLSFPALLGAPPGFGVTSRIS
jgi:hypothetical protein